MELLPDWGKDSVNPFCPLCASPTQAPSQAGRWAEIGVYGARPCDVSMTCPTPGVLFLTSPRPFLLWAEIPRHESVHIRDRAASGFGTCFQVGRQPQARVQTPQEFRHPQTQTPEFRGIQTPTNSGIQSPTRGGVRKGYAAHIWKSELALVRDNADRDVLSSVFAPVRSEINFQVDEFSQGQVTTPRLPEAFDGPCPVLGGHDVRYKLEVILDRAFHPPRYRPTKSQSARECGASAPFGFGASAAPTTFSGTVRSSH